jgi:zinc protease
MKKFILHILAVLVPIALCAQVKTDRSKVPAAGPAPAIQIGKYEMTVLDNGLRVIVVENHKLPRISWSIQLDLDPVFEGDKAGYVQMTGNLLTAGTASRTKAQIDDRIDFLGASLSSSGGGLFGSSLTKHADELLVLMQDVLLHPSFPDAEIEKLRKQLISGLASEKTDPNSISDKIGNILKYGRNHPYGEFPTEESLKSITRDDLAGHYSRSFRPGVAYLVVVGDILPEEAFRKARTYFGSWENKPVEEIKHPTPAAPSGNVVAFVPMPGAVQSVIDITYAVDLLPGTLEAIQASVLNNILGGSGFQSRLMQNLREDKAYTYGCYSSISPDEVIGSFSAGASVRNEVTDSSITQILFEMQRLRDELVDEATLKTVKNILTGSFARSLERPQTVANFAVNIEKFRLPRDYYETYLQKLNAVTAEDVRNIARRFLLPENAYITVVGNRETVPSLKPFSAGGKVEMYQADGKPLVEARTAPAGVTAQSVLRGYIDAIGGEKAIRKIKTYSVRGKMDVGPMSLETTKHVKCGKPGQFLMSVNMMGMEAMKQVFDGRKMEVFQMGAPGQAGEADILNAKMESDLLAELNYALYGVTASLRGVEEADGKDCYVIEMSLPDGSAITDYYDVKTGLRNKRVETAVSGDETTVTESIFREYLVSDAKVLFPKTVTVLAEGQSFDVRSERIDINPKLAGDTFTIR